MLTSISRTSRQLLAWAGMDRNTLFGKFGQDVLWNLASFAIMAACGVGINLIIGHWYTAGTLGVFNQTYSIYVIASQFAVAGIHLSVVKHDAQFAGEAEIYRPANTAALILAAMFAGASCFLLLRFNLQIGKIFHSPGVARGIVYITPGLFFFSINKILLSIFNGLSRMRIYAVYQSLRYILIIIGLLVIAMIGAPGESLVLSLTLSEIILFMCILPTIYGEFSLPSFSMLRRWLQVHLDFGMRSFLSNVLLQMNTHVDVLTLGIFWSDRTVGIYSFAAILVDGIFQLPVVLRTNYNPVLVHLISGERLDDLKSTVRKGVRITYLAMSTFCLAVVLLYPLGLLVISDRSEYLQSWPILAILLTGLVIGSGYIPFSNMLLQAGRPGLHTVMTGIWVATNIGLNWLLTPHFGVWGAAVATATAYALLFVFVKLSTRLVLGIRI